MSLQRCHNYLKLIRFDKPIGTFLLLWPTLWGLWVASLGQPSLFILVIFGMGVVLMRSIGCIINDISDRDIDGHVERTQNRPLVHKQEVHRVTVKEAYKLFIVLTLLAFGLLLYLAQSVGNPDVVVHGLIAFALACIYPLFKRFFPCPQFVLGIAFGYAIPMAFIAIEGKMQQVTWWLYSASILLTIIYDSFYAMADIDDDCKLGIHSSAIWFGQKDLWIIALLQVILILNLIVIGYILEFSAYYYFIFLILLLFIYQIKLASSRKPQDCLKSFRNNSWVGLIIFLGFVSEYL